jgi:hypothetical protein
VSGTARSTGPLAGLRVMDVSIMAAGPWTGALLGMLGAEVIKVEPPAGDGTRWVMPTQRGMGTNYLSMNVNKKGVVIDLKTPEGRAQGMELLAHVWGSPEANEGMDAFLAGRKPNFQQFRMQAKRELASYVDGFERNLNEPPEMRKLHK